jgi:hypothetical protein
VQLVVRWWDRESRQLSRLAALVLLFATSGCSLLFVNGPPERAEAHERIECTDSYFIPALDGVITALQLARTVYAFSRSDDSYRNFPISRPADIAAGGALTLLFGISTKIGVDRVEGCEAAVSRRPGGRPPARGSVQGPVEWGPGGTLRRVKSDEETQDEADEAAAVQAQAKARAAAEAKAAGEAAGANGKPAAGPRQTAPGGAD